MTLQNAPPGLDYDRDKRFSKSFKEMVAMCLVKDQTKRPTAEKLLKHSFFKSTKPPELAVKSLLADLPPLWDRVKALQLKDAAQLALKKMPSAEQEALSQSEYQRGVSAWNFDVEDLKAQASLDPSTSRSILGKSLVSDGTDSRENLSTAEGPGSRWSSTKDEPVEKALSVSHNQEVIDGYEKSRSKNDSTPSTSKQSIEPNNWRSQVGKKHLTYSGPLIPSNVNSNSFSERGRVSDRSEGDIQLSNDKYKHDVRKAPKFSGPLMLPNRASANSLSAPMRSSGGYGDSLEDKSKANVVQIKGRFSVTSENVDLVKDIPLCSVPRRSSQGSPLRKSASVGDRLVQSKQVLTSQFPKETTNSSVPASILVPHLQNLCQQTSFQQDLIVNLLNSLQQNELADASQTGMSPQTRITENELAETVTTEREHLLLLRIAELQVRMVSLTDELTAERLKHNQLQEQLNSGYCQEEIEEF